MSEQQQVSVSPVDDAEVERLADAIEGEEVSYCGPGYGTCGSVALSSTYAPDLVRSLLAALLSRWRLVPREGEERTEWGRRWPNRTEDVIGTDEAVARSMTSRSVVLIRRTVRAIPDGNGGTWVHTGPWAPVEDAKP